MKHNSDRLYKIMTGLAVMCLMSLMLTVFLCSCSTVTPPAQVTTDTASFDGNDQNSGLVSMLNDGSAIITEHARERYNALVAVYASKFTPKLKQDDGVQPAGVVQGKGLYQIDAQHLVMFVQMNQWRKVGRE